MPIYEYKCEKCNDSFEINQGMTEKSLSVCSKCKGSLTKIIGNNVGLSFKGSGFYVTDSKKSLCENKSCSQSCPKKDT